MHKSRNAEHAGAVLFILIDNSQEDPENELILNDDGTGGDINIPTVMISKKDGEQILSYMLRYD